ncbi:MAG: hypothetical protein U0263_24680 [Polyangiaceae bacterium]
MAAAKAQKLSSIPARTNMLLPGLLAWVSTVGVPAFERGVSAVARVSAIAALVAMVAGPMLEARSARLGRAVGIHATLALSIATWLLLGPVIGVQHLEPVRAAIGAVAWVLFAFGWGAVRAPGVPEEDPRAILGAPLPARSQLPLGSTAIFVVGLVGAAIPLFTAWRVARPHHALLSHAAAVVCAIALVQGGVRIAVERQDHRPMTPPTARLGAAVRPLTLLAVALILRFAWLLVE